MTLHTTTLGDQGPRVAFCHGLFGQGKNWTNIAKGLAANHRVTLIDLPDHGRSDWSEDFSYSAMADAVAAQLREIGGDEQWQIVGHSMGGKTVMLLALRHPELVERLAVVDISPVDYGGHGPFETFVRGMRSLPLTELTTRQQADEGLVETVPDPTIRSFLLQNLRRDTTGFRWQMNLDLLGDSLRNLADWPQQDLPAGAQYDGPTLWIAGAESRYIQPKFAEAMRSLFPHVQKVTIKGAGHWVHSEQPEVFAEIIDRFLRA